MREIALQTRDPRRDEATSLRECGLLVSGRIRHEQEIRVADDATAEQVRELLRAVVEK